MLQLAVTPALEAAARRALEAESLPRALRVELLGCLAERETTPPPDHDVPTAAVRGSKIQFHRTLGQAALTRVGGVALSVPVYAAAAGRTDGGARHAAYGPAGHCEAVGRLLEQPGPRWCVDGCGRPLQHPPRRTVLTKVGQHATGHVSWAS